MPVYLVTWDLNRAKPNYTTARANFIANIESFQNIKDPDLDSVRFIHTDWSADQVDEDLRTRLDGNDRLFVTKLIRGGHQGWLNQNVWDWINARL